MELERREVADDEDQLKRTFVFDDFYGAGFLVSCSVDCYSLDVVERLVEVSVKLLVYEDFWRKLIEHYLIVVRFWIPGTDFQFQGVSAVFAELGEIWLPRPCVVPEKSNAIIGVVTTGFECLPSSCDGLTGSEDHGPMISPVDTSCRSVVAVSFVPFVLICEYQDAVRGRADNSCTSSPCWDLLATMSGVGYHGYSAGRGVDPAGGAPGGG
ncbi:histone-lysine N-methyltransferase ATXR3 [Dorcoceras hygrometricum]|uniref:Histone-lysine N-methyltransferase ATXR3 n=1 Tax=Dorcoceras hygrometricum TaxID=472368 RepID=A0A2Z7CBY9_9LAMI|nr:histone-lysine N-methyltransferase ATXR3 [Dorcoceras hygrometricum]